MAIRYISDLHFGHKNIIRYDNRPWTLPENMDEEMVNIWNNTVKDGDLVYILGDVVWNSNPIAWSDILSKMKGRKIIVKGNHDKTEILDKMVAWNIIEAWNHQIIVHDPDTNGKNRYVVLNHSPMPFFVNMHHDNTYHLYGHVHISFDYQVIKHVRKQIEELYLHPVRMYNVGCMIRGMDFAPRTLDEIIQIDAENRKFEEGHEDDYLRQEMVKGQDKVETTIKNNL